LEGKKSYLVEITSEAEFYFLDLIAHLFTTHNQERALQKAEKILDLAMSLKENPFRGTMEPRLVSLGKKHRFLLYEITNRKQVKIIFFVDENKSIVYITDFFSTEMEDKKIVKRTR
jgi:plasmid stabilization system protein ParE